MLKTASFSIEDSEGINEILAKYKLAPGAHILVSDGKVCIPYEDGAPKGTVHKILDIQESMNTMLDQKAVMVHSNKVLDLLIDDAKARADEAEANFQEAQRTKQKGVNDLAKHRDRTKSAVEQLESQKVQNDHEIMRIDLNCQMFNEMIDELRTVDGSPTN